MERFAVEDEEREDISDAFWVWDDDGVLRVPDEAGRLFRLEEREYKMFTNLIEVEFKI